MAEEIICNETQNSISNETQKTDPREFHGTNENCVGQG